MGLALKRLSFKIGPALLAMTIVPLCVLMIFLVVPSAAMLESAFAYGGSISTHWFSQIFSSGYYVNFPPAGEAMTYLPTLNILYVTGNDFGVIPNSFLVAAIVTALSLVVGIPVAFILARYTFVGKPFLRILSMVPLLVTPFVNAYVVKKILAPDGLLNWFLYDMVRILPWRVFLDGLAAVTLTQAMTYFPILVLNAYASLLNVDPSLEEQAENLGASGFRVFRTVTLPLAMPGIVAGSTLVFIFSLEDLGAPIVFHGSSLARKLISFQIYSSFISQVGQRSPEIAALSVILLAIALGGFVLIRRYVSMKTYAMISRGARVSERIRHLTWKGDLLIYVVMLPVLIFAALPQIGVIVLAFSNRWTGAFPEPFTLNNLIQVFANPSVSRFLMNSLLYSTAATALAALLGFASAYATSRLKIRGISSLDVLTTSPLAMPGIVIAISYFYFFSTFLRGTSLDPTNPLFFDPVLILILAYAIRRLPFTARAIYAGLQQVDVGLEEASLGLGANRITTLFRVVIPLIIVNVLSGALISFIYSVSEVSVSITIGALSPEKGPMTVYMRDVWLSSVGSELTAAGLGFTLILLQLISILIVTFGFKQRYAFIGM
jgi:ABC-type Fe3+ transport system permease subunit